MCEQPKPSEPKVWLHVPLQTIRGDWLRLPADGSVTVLGYSGRLCERHLPNADSLMCVSTIVVRQWLLFDPIKEADAVQLLNDLTARLPVLAMREQVALRIPDGPLQKSPPEHKGVFNGPTPTLIPSECTPSPTWAEVRTSSSRDGKSVLGPLLAACPAIVDERVRTAIDLAIASRYDTLPRSIFLSQLTIIDSLAIRSDRPPGVCKWLKEKVREAVDFKDSGLLTGLEQLKKGSHGAAVQELVGRAALAKCEKGAEVTSRQQLVAKLYRVRSRLSHSDKATLAPEMVGEARALAHFVIDAAIQYPHILDAAFA